MAAAQTRYNRGMNRELGALSVVVLMLALPACSLARTVTTPTEAGGDHPDAFVGGLDAGPRPDAWSDIDAWSAIDAWTPPAADAWTPPAADAWTPPASDAWVAMPDAGGACGAIYGSANNYRLCGMASAVSCTFYVQFGAHTSCNDLCNHGARTCTSAVSANTADHCSMASASACSTDMVDAICTCSL